MKRTVLKLGLLLVAGAIINVAVAAMAWGLHHREVPKVTYNTFQDITNSEKHFLSEVLSQTPLARSPSAVPKAPCVNGWAFERIDYYREYSPEELEFTDYRIEFMTESLVDLTLADRSSMETPVRCARNTLIGWRLKSIEMHRVEQALGGAEIESLINPNWQSDRGSMDGMNAILRRIHDPPMTSPIWMPTQIRWIAFAGNTAVAVVVLLLVNTALIIPRRRRRIKRGLCPACAYPVGTNDKCTECGKPIAQT